MHTSGEYGIVYKGFLTRNFGTELVAIKTLKGELNSCESVSHQSFLE